MKSPPDPACRWPARGDVPPLGPGEVHVWGIELTGDEASVAEAARVLSADERERAGKYLFEKHRRRFTLGRAAQRKILGRYLAARPDELAFDYSALGKPSLAAAWNSAGLHFNLSNSHELALLAVTRAGACGIDVEHLHRPTDHAALAERYFSPAERDSLLAQGPTQLRDGFFRCWTRKEAMLKATGVGLTFPLARFTVSLGAADRPRVLSIEDDPARGAAWHLAHLAPGPDYMAALAAQVPLAQVSTFRWCDRV